MDHPRFGEDYVRRLKQGDSAVEEHFTAYFGQLLRIKLRSRGCSRWVDDVGQETLARVLEILRTQDALRNPKALGTFVHSVCKNVLSEYMRSEARWAPAGEAEELEDGTTAAELVHWDLRRQVEGVLAELSPTERAALKMVFLEETDRSVVCQRLGITPSYLRVVLYRAKANFREKAVATNNPLFRETVGDSNFTINNRSGSE